MRLNLRRQTERRRDRVLTVKAFVIELLVIDIKQRMTHRAIKQRALAVQRLIFQPRQGTGLRHDADVQAAIAEARLAIGLEQITLRVSTSSKSAIRLYERMGFQGCGVLPHAIKLVEGPGQVRYHDKLTMVLIL